MIKMEGTYIIINIRYEEKLIYKKYAMEKINMID